VRVLLQYEANKMLNEALKTYEMIMNSKVYMSIISGKLQVNMANIYCEMGNYEKAIRFYKMALDKVGLSSQCIFVEA